MYIYIYIYIYVVVSYHSWQPVFYNNTSVGNGSEEAVRLYGVTHSGQEILNLTTHFQNTGDTGGVGVSTQMWSRNMYEHTLR